MRADCTVGPGNLGITTRSCPTGRPAKDRSRINRAIRVLAIKAGLPEPLADEVADLAVALKHSQ
jgi:hypothetical protein